MFAAPFCFAANTLIDLAHQVKGTLPVANGGTGAATFTAKGVLFGNGTSAFGVSAVGTAGQVLSSGGSGANGAYISFPDVKLVPAANCVNGTAGGGWSYSNLSQTCRAGSNNVTGVLNAIPSTGATAYFVIELTKDWDTAQKPFIDIQYGSGTNTSGTVIWTVSSACSKQDGSVSDDPAFVAESAMGTQTMAAASRAWGQSAQLAATLTNCIGGSPMYFKVVLSGTASAAIQVIQAVVTTPRLLVVQAN